MAHFDPARFGASTNLLENPAYIAGAVSQLGRHFQVIELEIEDGAREILRRDATGYDLAVEELHGVKLAEGLVFSVHAPYVGEDCNLATDDSDTRRRSVELLKQAIRLAADLEARRLTYHPGHVNQMSTRHLMENLMRSLDELVPWAADRGVILCLENMGADRPNYIVFSPSQHVHLCETAGTRLTFDLVHHASLVSVETQFFEDLEFLLPHIVNIHLADANPPNHVHLPIEKGTMPLSDILMCLSRRGYEGNVIVEEVGGRFSSQVFVEQARRYRETLMALAAW